MLLIGGFLGAGKTTAITALANRLRSRGQRAAVITNDQAPNLVDTAVVRAAGQDAEEVAAGCFCCRFTDFLDAAERAARYGPDVLLCEPVGSCADISATVLNPLKHFYGATLQIAPLSVLVDPERVREMVLRETPGQFPAEVAYIFDQQLREADIIVLTKVDLLDSKDRTRLTEALEQAYDKPTLGISSLTGEGLGAWMDFLQGEQESGNHTLTEMDYATYAAGEAALGWLNATVDLQRDQGFNPDHLFCDLMQAIRRECERMGAEIAHLKATIGDGGVISQANTTSIKEAVTFAGTKIGRTRTAKLTINARVHLDPSALGGMVVNAIQEAAEKEGVKAVLTALQCFSPPYPRPPYTMRT